MAVVGTVSRASGTANGAQSGPVLKPTGLADGEVMLAVVSVPIVGAVTSVVTAEDGWLPIDHFHATAVAPALGVTQAWFIKPVPVAANEPSSYTFVATNIGGARVLVQVFRLSGRARTTAGIVKASASRSTSTAATATGSISPTGLDDWDVLYSGVTRSSNTFTGPDTEIDDYNPGGNTSSAIYALTGQAAGTYSKTVTASGTSGTGLGVIVAIPKYVAPVIPSPWRVRGTGGAPVVADLYVRGAGGVPVKITVA